MKDVEFIPAGHILSIVDASRRGAKKLMADVFKATRLADDWSAFKHNVHSNSKKV